MGHPNTELRREDELILDDAAQMEALSQSLASLATIRTFADVAAEAKANKENQEPTPTQNQEWRFIPVGGRETADLQHYVNVVLYYLLLLFNYLEFVGNLIYRTFKELWTKLIT